MANQILSGAVFQAGQVIAGIDADTILDTFIAPPPTGANARYYVVTAYKGDDGASGAGGAYVFDANDPTATPTKLISPDPYQNQFLGMSSAASSNHIVLGTWRDDGGNSGDYSKGAAYVYDVNDLTATPTKLTAFDGEGGDRFGWSVAASSDKIYVGATDVNNQGTSTTDGAVYVYDANDLSATPTRIDPFDAQTYPGKNFGVSVDVNSDHLFVGSFWGTTPTDSKMGAVYVYDVNDLSATPTKLTAFDDNPDDNARFGQYLSASSDHLVVGSYRDMVGSEMSGSAYVYDLSDLSAQPTKIGPFDANSNDDFGAVGSIAVSSSYVIVGSKGDDDGGSSSTGSVYVFDLNDLSATPTKITEPSPEQFAEFSKVAVFSDKLIIGAAQGGGVMSGTDTGTAYIYDLNDLSVAPTQLLAGDGQSGDYFGESVSIVPSPSTTLPTFIAPLSTTTSYLALGDPHYKNSSNQSVGGVYIYNQSDMSAPVTILEGVMYSDSGINYGIHLGSSILLTDTHIIVGNSVNHNETSTPVNSSGKTPRIMIWSLDDLSSPPTTIFHPLGSTAKRFGTFEGTLMVMGDKLFLQGANDNDTNIYVYDLTDLSANPIEITPPNLSGWYIGSFGDSFDIDPVSKKLYVGCWSSMVDGATYRTLDYSSGIVLVYDVSDLSSNINTHTATILNTDIDRDWNDKFGSCVRYHNGKLFIGHLANGNRKENLYVYDTSDLSFIQKFSAENIGQYGWGSNFAAWPRSVYVSDKGVVLGAPTSSPNEDDYSTGEVFVIPMDSSGNLGTLTKLSNSGLSVADGDRLGEHVTSFGDKIYATHKGSSGNNMKTVEWSWSNLSSNGSELSIVDPRSTFDHNGFYTTGMGVSPVPSLPAFIAPPAPAAAPTARYYLVHAQRDDDNGSMSGSVYVYDATDLTAQPTKLTAFDGVADDQFGQSMGANDDKIVIGSRSDGGNGNNSGSVYVYDANDLSTTPTKLTAFDGVESDFFGNAMGVSNDKIVVGATHDDDKGSNSGSLYVYDANDLSATPTKLTAFDGVEGDFFSYSIGVSNDKIVVGALWDDDKGSNSGSVYVYDANDLSATPTKLTAFDGIENDWFARSVSIDDNKIVVGAVWDDDKGYNSGSVYVYDANDLSATPTKLTAFDGVEHAYFGWELAVSDDNIVVADTQSSVYVYDANDLSTTPTKLSVTDSGDDISFGRDVSIVGDKILVGAPTDNGNDTSSGSVYVYDANDLSATPTKLTAFDGSTDDYFGHVVGIVLTT
jgi:hypothetical protein